jgi:hypothetical protein
MNKRRIIAVSVFVLLTLAACATQPVVERNASPGFFLGFFHGFIAWFALIGHIFDHDIRVYAFPNTGGWYDFGFLIGASCWAGGGGAAAKKK